MNDISDLIVAKSDQLNNVDLEGHPVIITVTGWRRKAAGQDQPLSIYFSCEDPRLDGAKKPWKPCKTMIRLLHRGWGYDPDRWIGRRIRLFRDTSVTFGNLATGGIRVDAMSDIDPNVGFTFPVKRGQFAEIKVKPLREERENRLLERPRQEQRQGPEQREGFTLEQILALADTASLQGTVTFRSWWNRPEAKAWRAELEKNLETYKAAAAKADRGSDTKAPASTDDEDPFTPDQG